MPDGSSNQTKRAMKAAKPEQADAERKVLARYKSRLANAIYVSWGLGPGEAVDVAGDQLAILKAAASALFPGDQKRRHVLPALGVMVTAACRVIRRGK